MIKAILVTTCLVFSQHQVCSTNVLHGVKDYEVVYPQKIHSLYKRDAGGSQKPHTEAKHADSVQYEMKVNGKKVILHLEKNKDLFSKDYTETHYSPDGREITRSPQIKDHCYYEGHIQNDSDSTASITACHGLRGYFKSQGEEYLIEPLKLSDSEEHAVFKYEHLEKNESPKVCGVTNTTWQSGDPIKKTSRTSTSAEKQAYLRSKKYVELYIAADHSMFRKYSRNMTGIRMRVFEIVNYINVVYKAINIHVALIGLEIWSDGDKIEINQVAGVTLDRFAEWRQSVLLKRKRNDNAQLITGIKFNGPTVGLAFVGTMCSPAHSLGIVQDHNIQPIAIGATIAHEMGHNFGMNHDTNYCTCKSQSCIMAAQLSYNIPREFSSCSLQDFQKYIMDQTPACITNMPLTRDIIAPPVCGNDFVEEGEECDCGSPEACTNKCCNATTCKLKPGAKCGFGECCENCQLRRAGAVCRAAKHDCDLPELCTGISHECPGDRFRVNGYPCNGDQGYCYMGKCPTLPDQCNSLFGPGAAVATDSCFNTNKQGVYYGYCKKANGTYIACEKKDLKCGKLYCTGGSRMPSTGGLVSFTSCKSSFPSNGEEDNGMVAPGTKCGDGSVCYEGQCMEIERAYRSTNCSKQCKGHAVCDHELQCQCEEGWAPPNCNDPTTNGYVIIIAVVLVIIVAAVICGLIIWFQLLKKKQNSSIHKSVGGASNLAFGQRQQQQQQQNRQQHVCPPENIPAEPRRPEPTYQNGRMPVVKPSIPPPPVPTAKPAFYPGPSNSAYSDSALTSHGYGVFHILPGNSIPTVYPTRMHRSATSPSSNRAAGVKAIPSPQFKRKQPPPLPPQALKPPSNPKI